MKERMLKIRGIHIIALFAVILGLASCTNDYRDVPAGYVGKLLTPTGFSNHIYEAGQVDIGITESGGKGNSLVLLESTTRLIKERFAKGATESDDHRITPKKRGIRLTVDVYVNVAVPEDVKERDSIFAQITPKPKTDVGKDRVSIITLEDVYSQLAQDSIRGKTRVIFASYEDDADVNQHRKKISDEIAAMVDSTFKENHVPLRLVSVQLSNATGDQDAWKTDALEVAADSEVRQIEKIGEAIRQNPGYLEYLKYKTMADIAATGSKNGTNTIIVVDTNSDIGKQLAANQMGRDKGATKASAPKVADSANPTASGTPPSKPVVPSPP